MVRKNKYHYLQRVTFDGLERGEVAYVTQFVYSKRDQGWRYVVHIKTSDGKLLTVYPVESELRAVVENAVDQKPIVALSQVSGYNRNRSVWVQESYESASGDARRRAAQLRKAGFHATVSSLGSQVTPLGLLRLSMVTVTLPAESDQDVSDLPTDNWKLERWPNKPMGRQRLKRQLRPDLYPPVVAKPARRLTIKRGAETRRNAGKGLFRKGDRVVTMGSYGPMEATIWRRVGANKGQHTLYVIEYHQDGEQHLGERYQHALRFADQVENASRRTKTAARKRRVTKHLCAWCGVPLSKAGRVTGKPLTPAQRADLEARFDVSHSICKSCGDEQRREMAAARAQNPPPELAAAAQLAERFNGKPPRRVRNVNIKWPRALTHLGPCAQIDYVSDKWGEGTKQYFHEFAGRCDVYAAPNAMPDGDGLLILKGKFKIKPEGITG